MTGLLQLAIICPAGFTPPLSLMSEKSQSTPCKTCNIVSMTFSTSSSVLCARKADPWEIRYT